MVSNSTPNARPNRYPNGRRESTLQEIFASYQRAAREELAAASQAKADAVNDASQAGQRAHIDHLFDDRFSHLLRQVEDHFQKEVTAHVSTQIDAAVSLAVSEAVEQTRQSTRRQLSQELN